MMDLAQLIERLMLIWLYENSNVGGLMNDLKGPRMS